MLNDASTPVSGLMDLRALRQQASLRIIDVAYRLNIAEGTIRNWEKGRSVIRLPVDQVALLCTLYDCSIYTLNEAMQRSRTQAVGNPNKEIEN